MWRAALASLVAFGTLGVATAPPGAAAVMVAGGSVGTPPTPRYPAIQTVVIQNPLPNFTVASPGPTNGPLTASELGALSSNPQQAETQFNRLATQAGFGAYLRLWTDANGPGKGANDIVVTLYRIPNLQDAASFASGSQQPYQQPGAAAAFAVPSIPGAHGYTVSISSPSQVTEQVVLFRSGPYVAIVQLASSVAASNPASLNPSDAISVSFQQYTATLRSLGTPTTGTPSGTSPAAAKGGGALPLILGIVGALVVLAAIAWLAAGPPRERRRRRRAIAYGAPRISHDAGVPPPVDVPSADPRPVRLARGPVIKVVEVDPMAGEPRAVPAARSHPVVARPVAGPPYRPEPAPQPLPVVEPAPVPEPVVEPEPVFEAGPVPEPPPQAEPVFEAESVFEAEPEPVPVSDMPPGPEATVDPWSADRAWADPEPVNGSGFEPWADPDLEELELAESASAELAAMELAELAGPALPAAASVPEGPAEVPAAAVDWSAPRPGPETPIGWIPPPPDGTPAGWLPDPSGSGDVVRYWDGLVWTSHVATRAVRR